MGKSPKETPQQTRCTDDDSRTPRSSWSGLTGKLQFKITVRHHDSPIRMAKIKNTGTIRGWGAHGWSRGNSYSSLVGKQSGLAALEDSLVVFLENETNSYHMIQQSWSLAFTQMNWKLMSTKTLQTHDYSSFIHNCQNLEASKMSFREWINKLYCIQIIKLHSALEEISSRDTKRHGGNLNACG